MSIVRAILVAVTTGGVMRFVIRAVFQAAVALALCGCFDNTQRDHDACVLKAIEIYKKEPPDEQSGLYVWRCMNAAGYLLDNSIKHCTAFGGSNPSVIQPLGIVALSPGCWKRP